MWPELLASSQAQCILQRLRIRIIRGSKCPYLYYNFLLIINKDALTVARTCIPIEINRNDQNTNMNNNRNTKYIAHDLKIHDLSHVYMYDAAFRHEQHKYTEVSCKLFLNITTTLYHRKTILS